MGFYQDLHPNCDTDKRYIKLIWGFEHPELDTNPHEVFCEAARELALLLMFIIVLVSSLMAWYFAFCRPKLAKILKRLSGPLIAHRLKPSWSLNERVLQLLGSILIFALEHYTFAHLLPEGIRATLAYTFAGRVLLLEMEAGWLMRWMTVMLHLVFWAFFARLRQPNRAARFS